MVEYNLAGIKRFDEILRVAKGKETDPLMTLNSSTRPRRAFAIVFIVLVLYGTSAMAVDWRDRVGEGDELYSKRHELNKGRENLQEAIGKYKEALRGIPEGDEKGCSEIKTRLSRAYFKLAYYFMEEGKERLKACEEGERWAKGAIEADPQNPEAYYWKAVNLGLYRDMKRYSFRGGLTGGEIKEGFQEAAALDERGLYGAPHMRLAEYLMARGDIEEAKKHATYAVDIEPRFLYNQIVLAEVLWENGDKVGSKGRLEYISSQPEDVLPSEILENREIIEKAKRILRDLKEGKDPDW